MFLVRESLHHDEVQNSAGIVIIQDNKILLAHPTGSPWFNTYSFPKGHIDKGETAIEAAIRETKEEIGLSIDINEIDQRTHDFIEYSDKDGKIYKRVYYYIFHPNYIINQSDLVLQKEEIDWAGFLNIVEADKRIFWRFKPLLKHLQL